MEILSSTTQLSAGQNSKLLSERLEALAVQQLPAGQNQSATVQIATHLSQQEWVELTNQSEVRQRDTGAESSFFQTDLVRRLSESITEREVQVSRVMVAGESEPAVHLSVTSVLYRQQQEQLTTQAMGSVVTKDGREISFLLELDYRRESVSETLYQFEGNRDLIDPLMINLEGKAPSLSNTIFEFDINSDGYQDSLYQPGAGTGFLVFDKNSNGVADNGRELFGPNDGQGFAELAQYDDDGNGWIDEGDAIYQQLSVMTLNENGQQELRSLAELEVGAIHLGYAEGRYDLYSDEGELQAQIQRSGVALSESGKALSVQEIHFAVLATDAPEAIPVETAGIETTINFEFGSLLQAFQLDDELIANRNTQTWVSLSDQQQQAQLQLTAQMGPVPHLVRVEGRIELRATELSAESQVRFDANLNPVPAVAKEQRAVAPEAKAIEENGKKMAQRLADLQAAIEELKQIKAQQERTVSRIGAYSLVLNLGA